MPGHGRDKHECFHRPTPGSCRQVWAYDGFRRSGSRAMTRSRRLLHAAAGGQPLPRAGPRHPQRSHARDDMVAPPPGRQTRAPVCLRRHGDAEPVSLSITLTRAPAGSECHMANASGAFGNALDAVERRHPQEAVSLPQSPPDPGPHSPREMRDHVLRRISSRSCRAARCRASACPARGCAGNSHPWSPSWIPRRRSSTTSAKRRTAASGTWSSRPAGATTGPAPCG